MAKKTQPATELAFWDETKGACWDRLVLDGEALPGVWSVEGECEFELDKKKSKGKDGASVSNQGYVPAEIVLHGEIHNRKEWSEMQPVLRALHPRKKGGSKNPIKVEHPALAVMGIDTVFMRSIKPPEISDGKLTLRIGVVEWIRPVVKKKPATEDTDAVPFVETSSPGLWSTREWAGAVPGQRGPDLDYKREYTDAPEFVKYTPPSQTVAKTTPSTQATFDANKKLAQSRGGGGYSTGNSGGFFGGLF